ncbi:11-beta-hydroxysteroid dehydrogenase-like 4A [Cynara cardunculus var. scolymus]|uniref:11-beta-hydroxysteroid dehydrogenase-like 4A n=1 Tax=Cynara cardunculus var. scolymus TaxID=59895 RepID=UPI000D62D14A|nr:11-beta-hydroxysteroid dehydrogenase-like 4A [Cynara cardunculus var. scolymus]
MYEALFNNKFTDALVFYFSVLLLLLFSPFLFTWELITTLRSCFQKTENVAGKVVLITGASSGIGELMAYEYAKRGACLAIIAIKEANSRLEEVAERARELGSPDVLFLFADVSKVDECRMFVDDTVKHFGRLDHLVMNAGIGPLYAIDIDVTKFRPVMDINFWGSVYPTQFAIPHLQKTKGKIIVNASSAGLLNLPKGGFYNASKAALISFYDSLRFEVSPTITITILTLGFIQTDFITAKYSTNGVGIRLKNDMGTLYPSMGAKPCAKAIVDGVCKGATSIAEPRFIKALIVVKFLFPELHRIIFDVSLPSDSPTD